MEGPTPEKSFVKALKSMDRKLGVKWNGRQFVVTYARAHGEPANIHLVRTVDGEFRQPDQRDLEFIKGGDLENESMKERLNRLARHCEDVRRKIRENDRDEIRAMTKDGKNQLIKAFTQAGNFSKGNATFRRITPKSKRSMEATA